MPTTRVVVKTVTANPTDTVHLTAVSVRCRWLGEPRVTRAARLFDRAGLVSTSTDVRATPHRDAVAGTDAVFAADSRDCTTRFEAGQ